VFVFINLILNDIDFVELVYGLCCFCESGIEVKVVYVWILTT